MLDVVPGATIPGNIDARSRYTAVTNPAAA